MRNIYKAAAVAAFAFLAPIAADAQVAQPKQINVPEFTVKNSNEPFLVKEKFKCWVTANNEFVAYAIGDGRVHVFVVQFEEKPKLNASALVFNQAAYLKECLVMSFDGRGDYYFALDDTPATMAALEKAGIDYDKDIIKAYYGYGIAHHYWASGKDELKKFKELKAARSIYDALGK